MACNSYKTLQVEFIEPAVPPANGYLVKWRPVGTSSWNQLSTLNGSPIYIPNVPICQNLEGTIQADCGSGNFGPVINFAVTAEQGECYTFVLLEDATYSYIPCAGSEELTIAIAASAPIEQRTICALNGSVSGGSFTRTTICFNVN